MKASVPKSRRSIVEVRLNLGRCNVDRLQRSFTWSMRAVQFRNVLQHYPVFYTVLCEGSVQAAAKKLRVSDAVVRRSLKEMRRIYNDELFVRKGKTFEPTAKAIALGYVLEPWLREFDEVVLGRPAPALRTCNVACTESSRLVILPTLRATLGKAQISLARMDMPRLGIGHVGSDFIVGHGTAVPNGYRSVPLMFDRLALYSGSKGRRLSVDSLVDTRFLAVIGADTEIEFDRLLRAKGLRRRRAALATSLQMAANMARAAQLTLVGTKQLQAYFRKCGLHPVRLPFRPPKWPVTLAWRTEKEKQRGHLHHRRLLMKAV